MSIIILTITITITITITLTLTTNKIKCVLLCTFAVILSYKSLIVNSFFTISAKSIVLFFLDKQNTLDCFMV